MTRRDLLVACLASIVTLCVVAITNSSRATEARNLAAVEDSTKAVAETFETSVFETPIMGSSVFDWNAIEAKPSKTGSVRSFFRAPTATLDELECHATTLNPGEAAHAPHQHPDEELIIVKEGTLEANLNGQLKRVGPGSIIFAASNQLHGVRNAGQTTAAYHVIRWNSPGMLKARPKQ